MKLYVCYTTKGGENHACSKACRALIEAGYEPKIQKVYGSGWLPVLRNTKGRRKVKELTGSYFVPALTLDDKKTIAGSENIINWAKQNSKS